MNVIDCYYRFEKLNNQKAKSRYDLIYSSNTYEPLNNPNKEGQIFIYLVNNPNIKTSQSKLSISVRGNHLTKISIPEYDKPNIAYGDKNNDAILIIINENSIELLIFFNKKNVVSSLYNLLYDNELKEEIEHYRRGKNE